MHAERALPSHDCVLERLPEVGAKRGGKQERVAAPALWLGQGLMGGRKLRTGWLLGAPLPRARTAQGL
jgi:hypothetical protein